VQSGPAPVAEKNPLLFWQVLSLLLFCLVLFLIIERAL